MKIAVASGKGGTGKTTVSTALALALSQQKPIYLLDCDVEEPNAHIFIKGEKKVEDATVAAFAFDNDKCINCQQCSKVCRFNAIACLASGPLYFAEMCHGCGGCLLACPVKAVLETERINGTINTINNGNLSLIYGVLNVGEAMASPLIRRVKSKARQELDCIIDSPPGASCAMLAAVNDCDFVVMVTEPTPFGLHDLRLAIEALKELGLRYGVVVNRAEEGIGLIRNYCADNDIKLLLEIPEQRYIAEGYSQGLPLTESYPQSVQMMHGLYSKIEREVANG